MNKSRDLVGDFYTLLLETNGLSTQKAKKTKIKRFIKVKLINTWKIHPTENTHPFWVHIDRSQKLNMHQAIKKDSVNARESTSYKPYWDHDIINFLNINKRIAWTSNISGNLKNILLILVKEKIIREIFQCSEDIVKSLSVKIYGTQKIPLPIMEE